jgi:hypothetical protein
MNNSLIGVLMRFRMENVPLTADIEHMFHCVAVSEHHRNYLRFFCYRDNDPEKPLTEYRMCVHEDSVLQCNFYDHRAGYTLW